MGDESEKNLIPPDLAARVSSWTGVDVLRGGLDATISEFVKKRCTALGYESAAAYFERAVQVDASEQRELMEAVSIPHTWFFRDREQLELALDFARPNPIKKRPLRVWIPGCATGEEAYSLVILAMLRRLEVSVLATDINSRALRHAQAGLYDPISFRELPQDVAPYFTDAGRKRVPHADVRNKVTFERHNLVDPARTAPGGWDLILCRNVVIYFSKAAALACVKRMGSALAPQGAIVLGAGELAADLVSGLTPTLVGSRVLLVREESTDTASSKRSPTRPPQVLPPSPPLTVARRAPTDTPEPKDEDSQDPLESLLQVRDLTTAAKNLEAAIDAHPDNARFRLCLGVVRYMRGDYRRAGDALTEALRLAPDLWPAMLYLGLCFERTSRARQAEAVFRRAQELFSTPQGAHHVLPEKFAALAGELLAQALRKYGAKGS